MARTTSDIVLNEIYPLVSDAISKNTNAYMSVIQKFLEVRSEDIHSPLPCARMFFSTTDIENFFNALKLKEIDILAILKKAYYFDIPAFNPRAATDPYTICMMCIIRYFCMKNDMKKAEISSIYLAFSGKFYVSIHSHKFQYPPNKDVMEYVVNIMMNNQYDLKTEGSVFGVIRKLCITWLEAYKDKLTSKTVDDEDFADIIQQLHNRIKSMLNRVATLYYKAYEEKLYMRYESDSTDENNYHIADNDSIRGTRYVENAMNRITGSPVDFELCKKSSDANVKTDEIKSIIETIQDCRDNLPLIKEMVTILVFDYLANGREKGGANTVSSIDFINYSIAVKPNSKNKNIIRLKEIVETFLNENSPGYVKRKSRYATKSSYQKSLIKYYSLVIFKANKGK